MIKDVEKLRKELKIHLNSERFQRQLKTLRIASEQNRGATTSYLENLENFLTKVTAFRINLEQNLADATPYLVRSKELDKVKTLELLVKGKISEANLKSEEEDVPSEIPEAEQSIGNAGAKTEPEVENFIGMLTLSTPCQINQAFQQLSESTVILIVKKIERSKILLKLFDALAEAGNVNGIEKVNTLLPERGLHNKWYINSRAKAFGLSGQADQWLDEWNKKVDETTSAEALQELEKVFPHDGFFNLVKHNTELLAKCEFFLFKTFL